MAKKGERQKTIAGHKEKSSHLTPKELLICMHRKKTLRRTVK